MLKEKGSGRLLLGEETRSSKCFLRTRGLSYVEENKVDDHEDGDPFWCAVVLPAVLVSRERGHEDGSLVSLEGCPLVLLRLLFGLDKQRHGVEHRWSGRPLPVSVSLFYDRSKPSKTFFGLSLYVGRSLSLSLGKGGPWVRE